VCRNAHHTRFNRFRVLLLRTTEFIDGSALDSGIFSSPDPSPQAHGVDPAPAPEDLSLNPIGPEPERAGTYRQLFLTVWRGERGAPSSFRFADPVRWCVGQREECPGETRTIHEHYWIVFSRPVRVRTAERSFEPVLEKDGYRGGRVWGTNDQVHRYVTKVGLLWCCLPFVSACFVPNLTPPLGVVFALYVWC